MWNANVFKQDVIDDAIGKKKERWNNVSIKNEFHMRNVQIFNMKMFNKIY